MNIYNMTEKDLSDSSNTVKDNVIMAMVKEGYISKEKGEEFGTNYGVIAHTKGLLGRTLDKLLGVEDSRPVVTVVKIIRVRNEPVKE